MPSNPIFSGLSAFPITSMDAAGRVDAAAYEHCVARLAAAGVDSIGVLGSTGAYPYLARDERRRAVEIARSAAGTTPLLVGVGAMTTHDAVACAKDAAEAGADALLLAPVSYWPLLDDEVFALFEAVAGASERPVCVYNNPVTTHFTVGPALLSRLAGIPNVVAAKNPAPARDEVAETHAAWLAAVGPDFSLGYSADVNAAEALIAGGKAWYSVAAGTFPKPFAAICRAIAAADTVEARRVNADLEPLWALFRKHTSFRVVHAAANILGLSRHQPPRPVLPLGDDARRQVTEVIEALDLA